MSPETVISSWLIEVCFAVSMRVVMSDGDGDEQEVEGKGGRKMKKRRRGATIVGELRREKSVEKSVDVVDVADVKGDLMKCSRVLTKRVLQAKVVCVDLVGEWVRNSQRSKSEGSATTTSAGARLVNVLLRHRTAPGPRPLLPGAMAACLLPSPHQLGGKIASTLKKIPSSS
ncbi:hypothetical protein BKA66DRAFT_130099 [Pyrenochaeta sp. MPI-SDFR-AT-0127]|nr:hypothetical protein BKA66DRAFT_130099 [Pyrenochaeta sp. MPI-SDFR-AT-0127]